MLDFKNDNLFLTLIIFLFSPLPKIYIASAKYIRILALHSEFSKGPKHPALLINS